MRLLAVILAAISVTATGGGDGGYRRRRRRVTLTGVGSGRNGGKVSGGHRIYRREGVLQRSESVLVRAQIM